MNKIATNLTPEEVKAMSHLNDNMQNLAADIHGTIEAVDNHGEDDRKNPKQPEFYKQWVAKIKSNIDSNNGHMNAVVNEMLDTDIAKYGDKSIYDAEDVVNQLLNQINDYYRIYWQSPAEMAQCISILEANAES